MVRYSNVPEVWPTLANKYYPKRPKYLFILLNFIYNLMIIKHKFNFLYISKLI